VTWEVPVTWTEWAQGRANKTRARDRWRQPLDFDARGPRGQLAEGRSVVSFASNDYLGLSSHPEVVAAAHDALDRWGTGAGASRLVSGSRPVHSALEQDLADWKGTEAACALSTGYAANLGLLSALAGPQVLICSDELNHASIIDGCRLARALGARVEFYPHGDVDAVSGLLASSTGRSLVVTDSVFSMDGDSAPIDDLAQECGRRGALLVLDEAHAVLGPEPADPPCELLRVGTLSKTLGSLGGFVAGSRTMVELLVNRCRPYIFSTALTPADAAAARAALGVLRSPEGEALCRRLARYAARVGPHRSVTSPIVPILVGQDAAALAASASLLDEGLFIPAIRPPTVPPGTARLRVTLSAAHTPTEVEKLVAALAGLGLSPRDHRTGTAGSSPGSQ
jgi:8-amino-7-oxononanoate synthase